MYSRSEDQRPSIFQLQELPNLPAAKKYFIHRLKTVTSFIIGKTHIYANSTDKCKHLYQ